jgi:IMP dehydrogenase
MKALTYDDIQLVPKYSSIESRSTISLRSQLTKNHEIEFPLIAAPMPTVCELQMAKGMYDLGGVGCIHRFMSINEQADIVSSLRIKGVSLIMAAVGASGDYLERVKELHDAGVDIILIDVAHGHHEMVKNAIQEIRKISECDIIAGNIATAEAALDLQDWGADALRVGIGGGSLCTTRIKTGFGIPNVTCLQEIIKVAKVPVIADGGIRTSGDIAKALALGASTVMVGSMIAGTDETPGSVFHNKDGAYKKYSGAASFDTKATYGQAVRNIEGESTTVVYKGSLSRIADDIKDSLRSALSYAGARNMQEYNPAFVEITQAGSNEAKPHLIL